MTVHLSSPFIPLLNPPCFSHKPPLLFIISTSIVKKKVWVFLFSLDISCFLPWFLWFFELMFSFEKLEFRIWVGFIRLSLLNVYCCHWEYDACYTCFCVCFSFFSSISCLCCAMHFMLVIECHNDSYLWLCGVHWLHCT